MTATSPPRFGVYLLPVDMSWEDLRGSVVRAEELGFDFVWTHDNVVGPLPWGADEPVFDAWSVLGALGEATSTIRLGPMVTPMGRRHPSLFAKMTSSFDITSGGRLDLGMGPGDEAHQFEPWGQRFPERPGERIAILEEELEVLTRLWTEEQVTFVGEHYQLEHAAVAPKPLQRPHPPIWIGLVFGRKVMPRVAARWADGVNFYAKHDDEVVATIEQVRRLRADLGRGADPLMCSRHLSVWVTDGAPGHVGDDDLDRLAARFGRTRSDVEDYVAEYERMIVGPPEHVAEELLAQLALGVDHIAFNFLLGPGPAFADLGPVDGLLAAIERLATEVVPAVRAAVTS